MSQVRRFTRRKENFVCENCGTLVIGDGWTNHCPVCLYSKHVDIYPGDRACECNGMMRPVAIIAKKDQYVIEFKCEKCGVIKHCKSAQNDNFETILDVMKQGGVYHD